MSERDIKASTKLYEKDAEGVFRLIREVLPEEMIKAKLKGDPIFVLKNSIDDTNTKLKDLVLFIHGNKKGKKIYRAKKTDVIFDLRKNGNFADALNEELKKKLGIKS
jgi:hypothetical protein